MSHPLRVPFHVSGRAKSHAFLYFQMCCEALVRYRKLVAELEIQHELDPARERIFDQVERASIEPVVFAGMCLEATLYDLSACLFGEEFAEQIDKLDPLGKFFVIARCVDRESPSKGGITAQAIQAVISARNKLVHHKSQDAGHLEDLGKVMARAEKNHKLHVAGIVSSVRALVLSSIYFDGNIFEELRILPSFKKQEYWESVVPKELHEEVRWCIEAAERERQHGMEDAPAP
jgi:hypothetical protein